MTSVSPHCDSPRHQSPPHAEGRRLSAKERTTGEGRSGEDVADRRSVGRREGTSVVNDTARRARGGEDGSDGDPQE